MSDDMKDKYPHWRDALFGNHDAVANIRCAVHYVFWHTVYAILAALGLAIVAVVKLLEGASTLLGPLGSPVRRVGQSLDRGIAKAVNHPYASKVGEVLSVVFLGSGLLLAVGLVVYCFYIAFWQSVMTIGIVVGIGVAVFALLALAFKLQQPANNAMNVAADKANRAGRRAVKTPGIRRVYGECPVSMGQAPKWFDDMFPDK